MSCFVVPAFHIDALVSWAVGTGAPAFIDGLDPRGLAAELYLANCTAYRSRYGEDPSENYLFTMRPEAHRIPAVQILKAVACLRYQCSDWENFPGSAADRALDRMRDHAVAWLSGYRAAAWTLEEVTA